ncbi:MAG: creatininase family protein [Candidatus Bathyarchaeia archaeon]
MLSSESREPDIARIKPIIAVQPIGSMEQHGLHLPVSTDTIIACEVSRALAERIEAFLLPPIPYSCSIEHSRYTSTIWLRPFTLHNLLKDIAISLRVHGFKALIIVNGHGGNYNLKSIVREINYRFGRRPLTLLVDLGSMYFGSRYAEDIHAGRYETSLMLYLKPELVGELTGDSKPEAMRDYIDYISIDELTPTGVWGEPSRASREEGERIFERIVDEAKNYVLDVLKKLGIL